MRHTAACPTPTNRESCLIRSSSRPCTVCRAQPRGAIEALEAAVRTINTFISAQERLRPLGRLRLSQRADDGTQPPVVQERLPVTCKATVSAVKEIQEHHPPDELSSTTLRDYLSLPVEEYSLLDPRWIRRAEGASEGRGKEFVIKVPLADLMNINMEPQVGIEVNVDPQLGQVEFHLTHFTLGEQNLDKNFNVQLQGLLSQVEKRRGLRWRRRRKQQQQQGGSGDTGGPYGVVGVVSDPLDMVGVGTLQQNVNSTHRGTSCSGISLSDNEHIGGGGKGAGSLTGSVVKLPHQHIAGRFESLGLEPGGPSYGNTNGTSMTCSQRMAPVGAQSSLEPLEAQGSHGGPGSQSSGPCDVGPRPADELRQPSPSTTSTGVGVSGAPSPGPPSPSIFFPDTELFDPPRSAVPPGAVGNLTSPSQATLVGSPTSEGPAPLSASPSVPPSYLQCKVALTLFVALPRPLSRVPRPLLASTGGLILRLVLQAILPNFLDLLVVDYHRWARGTQARDAPAGSLLPMASQTTGPVENTSREFSPFGDGIKTLFEEEGGGPERTGPTAGLLEDEGHQAGTEALKVQPAAPGVEERRGDGGPHPVHYGTGQSV